MTQETRLLHVNIARATPIEINGRSVLTAIGKRPVAGAIEVHPLGLAGDEQADLSVHGGLGKAVYAYPIEETGSSRFSIAARFCLKSRKSNAVYI